MLGVPCTQGGHGPAGERLVILVHCSKTGARNHSLCGWGGRGDSGGGSGGQLGSNITHATYSFFSWASYRVSLSLSLLVIKTFKNKEIKHRL